MTAPNAVAVVVEPPLPVANTLLDEARRLASRLGEAAGVVTWMRPHRYAAPIAVMDWPVDEGLPGEGPMTDLVGTPAWLDPVLRALDLLARGSEEFAVQLGPVGLEPCGDRSVVASRLVSARPEDLSAFLDAVASRVGDVGMRVVEVPAMRVVLGLVQGEGPEAVRDVLEPKETPVAGWLLGGVCLARAWLDPEVGVVEAERLRFVPLRRLGSRR